MPASSRSLIEIAHPFQAGTADHIRIAEMAKRLFNTFDVTTSLTKLRDDRPWKWGFSVMGLDKDKSKHPKVRGKFAGTLLLYTMGRTAVEARRAAFMALFVIEEGQRITKQRAAETRAKKARAK